MKETQDRDVAIDRWLRRAAAAPAGPGPSAACLDAEVMAAWADGGLSDAALRVVRAHVADCQRCQVLAAVMARIESAATPAAPERSARRWLGWMLPLTAAAGAIVIWLVLPRGATPLNEELRPATQIAQVPAPPPAPTEAQALGARPATPPAADANAKAPKLQAAARQQAAADPKPQAAERNEAARANVGRTDEKKAVAVPTAAAPPPPAATPVPTQMADAAAGRLTQEVGAARLALAKEIATPDTLVRWRIRGAIIEKTSDAGKTREPVSTGVSTELTAGASTSSTVCWLVGRAGVVLLTTDGRTWRRLSFPETTDLSAVRATDARSAIVPTADGREFATSDAGATWVRRLLQEN